MIIYVIPAQVTNTSQADEAPGKLPLRALSQGHVDEISTTKSFHTLKACKICHTLATSSAFHVVLCIDLSEWFRSACGRRCAFFGQVRALEEERDPLEEQASK